MIEQFQASICHNKRQDAHRHPAVYCDSALHEFLNTLIRKYHLAEYIIDESGAYDLKKWLRNEIDSAILLKPSELNPDLFNEVPLQSG